MKWFYNLKIGVKLIISFLIVAIMAGIVGIVGLININNITKADKLLYEENALGLEYTGNAGIYFQRIRYNVLRLTLANDGQQRTTYHNKVTKYVNVADDYLKKYEDGIINEVDRKQFDVLKSQWEKYKSVIQNVDNLVQSGNKDQAQNIVTRSSVALEDSLQSSLDKLLNYNSKGAKSRIDSNTKIENTSSTTMIIIIIFGIIVALFLGLFIARIISSPVKKLVDAAEKIAIGNIDVKIESTTKDEIGTLMRSFDKMIENIREQALTVEKIASGDVTVDVKVKSDLDLLGLKMKEMVAKNNEVLSNINAASEQVSAGAKQVSISSQALSQGSTEQAASLEEITSSITEIAAQTKQNAANATQANELAMATKDSAIEGNQQMKGMLKAMEEINDSSANISKIIKVIDEIAFQTNILALNAAVEAARAGQHGKGFAVVAEEVRNLAARSANAAKETTGMIEGSIKKVEAGTKIANETANALNKIVESVSKATNLVAEIANASNQQASAITQINQGIEQVSQVTQSNTATAEESASASEELSSQAELLKNMVAQFKIRKNQVFGQINGVSSEVIRALEDLVAKKGSVIQDHQSAMSEAAPTGVQSKVKIHLDDTEFGKY